MLKRVLARMLLIALAAALFAVPVALASDYYSARTPLAGASSAKRHNIALAVDAIDGIIIPYGGRFSFNDIVGPRTQDRGYETASNGRGAMVTGGGVAQVASTLYLALLEIRGDVRIDPVRTYGSRFVEDYVDDPDMAVVTDYDADIDLSFLNRDDEMTIEMWMNDNYLYCSITVGEDDSDGYDRWSIAAPPAPAPTAEPARRLIASVCLCCGDDDDVLHNVELAADSICDTTLSSGDTFSFNDVVGPRSRDYGFVRATNGRGVRVTGGGVAQVASALWLAIKDDGSFAVLEKSTYGRKYNQHYVSNSADAILTDYSAGRDFSFRYTGPGSVTIYTYTDDDWLYCEIYRN